MTLHAAPTRQRARVRRVAAALHLLALAFAIGHSSAMGRLYKYPRTRHILGSRLQEGDEDLEAVAFEELRGRHLVVEEKIDGANSGISFDPDSLELQLQSRGHFLAGGPRERHFNLFKQWAAAHQDALLDRLEDRYVVYGEWMYAKHTEYYDLLPHYWLEFDVFDRRTETFLSTSKRRVLLKGLPVVSVPVIGEGRFEKLEDLTRLIRPSLFKSSQWRVRIESKARNDGLDFERVQRETDWSDLAEGIYVKDEAEDLVVNRYKYVRAAFVQQILEADSHWQSRPIISNDLAPGMDIFARAAP
jgi:ATP-dependent RNA circularization protein (DNA/RNA ligase family)